MSTAPGRVRVLLHLRAEAEQVPEVEEAYHLISKELDGTPGLLGNELLRDLTAPGGFAVLSAWDSLAAFRAWEEGAAHRGTTSPLRAFQDRGRPSPFALFEVAAAY
ncbi:antibiotic biosynthesis monooxygenase family protein [Streptomyces antibioticus]|uniref:antibiotic biosynthesis monooxygenase family protein n=1 Tax=Streptomyces antibioticus TaxID=1890 RepID=UPI0036DEBB8D